MQHSQGIAAGCGSRRLMNFARKRIYSAVWHASMTRVVPAAALALGGLATHGLVYAVFRGHGQMHLANALQLLNNGFVPVTAFFLAPHDAAAVLALTGVAWLAISGSALVALLFREKRDAVAARSVGDHLRMLLRFGIPRIPGEFALVGLFALPALIALRANGVVAAGHFSAGLSVYLWFPCVSAPIVSSSCRGQARKLRPGSCRAATARRENSDRRRDSPSSSLSPSASC